MSKKKLVLLSFYDQHALGSRCLAAAAIEAGYEATLLILKIFRPKYHPHDRFSELKWMYEQGHMPVIAVHPFDAVVCPYPYEVTDDEFSILWKKIDEEKPDVVGFSITSVFVPLVKNVSAQLRQRHPEILQIWGGIHPTLDPIGCLEFADAVCVGEGEGALLDYLQNPSRNDILNICKKNPETGEVICNPLRPLIQELDTLPLPLYGKHDFLIEDNKCIPVMELPDDELMELPIITSTRGCPFGCSYCLHGNVRSLYSGQKYLRRKSVDRFLDDLEYYKKHFPLPGFNMFDDVFVIGKEWIDEFCEKYPKRFLGVPFACYAHPATCNLDMLKKIRKAGAVGVSLGIQTGSNRLNKQVYNRNTPMHEYIRIGKEIVEAGYDEIVYDIMTHCEYETEEDYKATAELLSQMPKPFRLNIKRLMVYPFAPIGELPLQKANVPEKVAFFYEMLFLLAEAPGFDPKLLPLLLPAVNSDNTINAPMELMRHLYRDREQREQLQHKIPWGVRRAAKHLFNQIGESVKTHLSKK
ncbi:MAG: radical SAM protein [Candidatus Sumerlaeales bacterium]|nr:radical SAM protein [Candidatus Sumerlaeales bacterium]